MIEVVPATADHIEPIASDPRRADADEVHAAGGRGFRSSLEAGLKRSSHVFTVLADGVPVAMLGVVAYSALTGIGVVWMLGSSALESPAMRRAIIRYAPPILAHLRDLYPGMLFNHVDVRNRAAIRFLRWVGFTIMAPLPTGRDGALFHPFYIQGAAE